MRNRKNPWILVILLLAGAIIGGFAGELLSRYPYFAWMGLGEPGGYKELFAFTLNPAINTGIMRLGFDFALRINAGSIVGMILSVIAFLRL